MKILKVAIAFFLVTMTEIANASPLMKSFSGEWDWTDAPDSQTFSMKLKIQGNQLVGQYCAVSQNGQKTDCDDEKNPNIHGELDKYGRSVFVEFSSFFGAKKGDAVLKFNKERLIWHVTKNPVGGDFYAPEDAVLDRH